MADTSATFAPNRCFLANTGGTSIPIGCCENGKKLRKRAAKNLRRRARNTPCQAPGGTNGGCCNRTGNAARACGCGRCR